jgi:nucleoside-diphosphate-sugar epimerase
VRYLVSGDAGFIGGRLRERLTRLGHQVRGMDARNMASTADYPKLESTVDSFSPHVIVHCGASCSTRISLEKPRADFVFNAVGTVNVAEVARTHGNIPVLYTSTVKVNPGQDGLVAPLGLSKKVGEDYLALYRDLYGLPVVTLQPSTVYGPGQLGDRNLGWVSHFVRSAVEGKRIELYGSGDQTRDVLFIDDFVDLVVDILNNFDRYEGGIYPVGGGPSNEISLVQLLHHLGITQWTRKPALPTDLGRVVTDNSAVTGIRGWKPTTGWVDGVRKTREAL